MKVQVSIKKDVFLKSVKIQFPTDRIRDDDNWGVLNTLFLTNDNPSYYELIIDLDSGKVLNKGCESLNLNLRDLKICDEGIYTLLDEQDTEVFKKDNCYIPEFIPNSYGDYLQLNIEGGVVVNWSTLEQADFDEFINDYDDE